VLRLPAGPPASLEELHHLTEEAERHESGSWYLDEIYLCSGHDAPRRLWEYDVGRGRVVDVTSRLPSIRRAHCGAIRGDAPLEVRVRYDAEGTLHWSLGPWQEGRWTLVLRDGVDAYRVPSQAAFRLGLHGALPLRVRYDSPAGWTTYSPVLRVSLDGFGGQIWKRPASTRPTTRRRGSS
jgi:hypothetical protein